jgi:filamentous hemagglutinin family protein
MFFNLSSPSIILAGPEDAQVVNGQVSFQQSGSNTTITASDQSIINYSSFDIAKPEVVQFIQPSSNASVLNRILSANPTIIDGTLLANGRVFFINPAGIMIGSSSKINVNQLIASALNMSNSSFLSGQYEFAGGNGTVINKGDISAQSVYLAGKQVTNTGNIECPNGYIVMAAGDRVFLGQPGSNVVVEIGYLEPPDQTSTQLPAQVTNEGTVNASGGTIILAVAGDALSRPIMANIGTLSTSVVEGEAGNISLQAVEGQIDNTGLITAESDSGTGGTVTVNGAEVVNSGTVDVSGAQGGTVAFDGTSRAGQFGTISADGITGDGGSIELRAGGVVTLGSDSLTTANAGVNGNGGDVVVFSPDTALFRDGAQVEAKGGSESGDGGFFEISGKQYVEVQGQIDLTTQNGQNGNFLIDPYNIIIDDSGLNQGSLGDNQWEPSGDDSRLDIDVLEDYLGNADVTITTGTLGEQHGDVIFDADRNLTSGIDPFGDPTDFSFTIKAGRHIEFTADDGINFEGGGDVRLFAGPSGHITSVDKGKANPTISTLSGDIIMEAGSDTSDVGIDVGYLSAGASGLDHPGEIRLATINGGDITTEHLRVIGNGYGSIYVSSTGNLTINGSSDLQGAVLINTNHVPAGRDASSFVCLTAEKDTTINGDVRIEAHGKDKTRAGIWIGAGTEIQDGTITVNGNLHAEASTAQDAPFRDSEATIKVYAKTINLNGNKVPHAKADRTEVKTDSYGLDEQTGADRHFLALVDIDNTKNSACLDCTNRPLPVAWDDLIVINKDTTIGIDVLENDSDESGNPLVDGTVDSYTDPAGGGLLTPIEVDGEIMSFEYTPPDDAVFEDQGDSDESGAYAEFTDAFEYYAKDIYGQVSTEPAIVTITVKNYIPVASDDSTTIHMNTTDNATDASFNLQTLVSDADGSTNPLIFGLVDGDTANGTVMITGDIATYEPDGGYVSPDSQTPDTFQYTVSDDHIVDMQGDPIVITQTVSIIVTNELPVADGGDATSHMGSTINSSAGFHDVADDGYTDAVIVFDYTQPSHGTVAMNPDGTFTYEPADPGYVGLDSFEYSVADAEGVVGEGGTGIVNIEFTNITPVADGGSGSGHMGTTISGSAGFHDVADGGYTDAVIVVDYTQPSQGTVAMNPDGSFTYEPVEPGYVGPDSFEYSVADAEGVVGEGGTGVVNIELTNVTPIADGGDATGHMGTTISGSAGFHDVADDGYTDAITVADYTQPSHGAVIMNSDGTFTYEPANPVYVGPDSFEYSVEDAQGVIGDGGTGIVYIELTNITPVADGGSATGHMGTTISGSAAFHDVADDGYTDTVTVVSYGQPSYGTVVMNPDGTFTYEPTDPGYVGTDNFECTVTDTQGVVGVDGTGVVTIAVTNTLPVASGGFAVIPINNSAVFNIQNLISDVDGDPLDVVIGDPANGTLSQNPNGSYTYTPNLNYIGVDSFAYYVSDSQVGIEPSQGTVIITVGLREITGEEASSTSAPSSPEFGEIGQIEGAYLGDLLWLAQELGLCEGDEQREDGYRCQEITQAYLAGAFLQSTDLHPYQAANRLRGFVEILHDTDGIRIAALIRVINEFVLSPAPPSDEQMDSIAEVFAQHSNDGTHYAAAGQWLDALSEYVAILNSEIGWPADESIAFVMGKYGTAITEAGEVSVAAFVQIHLEGLGG